MYRQGHITPIRSVALFEASEIEQSFRYLQKGDHIGKAVVKIPEYPSEITSVPRAKAVTLDPDASYLLTGGLGGLGRSIATWLVERGARHLLFLSRSAGKTDGDKEYFAELESLGCSICAVAGKVNDAKDLDKAISKATRPIKGVIHLAMVLRVRDVSPAFPIDCTDQISGWSHDRPHLQRLDNSSCTKSRRRLESPQCVPIRPAGLLHHDEFPCHPHRRTRPKQLQCRKHLP